MMSSVRCFIALEIPTATRQQCVYQISRLKTAIPHGIRWESVEKIHLTLHFLGDVPREQILPLSIMLEKIAHAYSPFDLNIASLGVFPKWQAPRVIWLGLDHPPVLMAIQRVLGEALNTLGFVPEKKAFSPHLTLGRVEKSVESDECARIGRILQDQADISIGKVRCDTLYLFQSQLKPTGSVYLPIHAVKLGD